MTYRELMGHLQTFRGEDLDRTVTVIVNSDEYVSVTGIDWEEYTDVLDAGHPILLTDD